MKSSTSNHSGTRLFFIEFLIVLFSLSDHQYGLSAAVRPVTQYDKAYRRAVSGTGGCSFRCAELLEAGGDSVSVLLTAYPEAVLDDSGLDPVITICFDQDFHSCSPKKESYSLTVPLTVDNHEESATISVCKSSGEVIYTLDVSFHRPLTREEVLS